MQACRMRIIDPACHISKSESSKKNVKKGLISTS